MSWTGGHGALAPPCADLPTELPGVPLLHAVGHAEAGPEVRRLLSRGPLSSSEVEAVKVLVRATGARESTVEVAERYATSARSALRKLPQQDATIALEGLLDFTLAQTSMTPP